MARMCKKDAPVDVYCFKCDERAVPFHKECWDLWALHGPRFSQNHYRVSISSSYAFVTLTSQNKQKSIPHSKFKEDKSNCFIKFKKKFRFGDRAFPLLRGTSDHYKIQYPSFVSFVGRSMHGKSFLVRALQYTGSKPTPNLLLFPVQVPTIAITTPLPE